MSQQKLDETMHTLKEMATELANQKQRFKKIMQELQNDQEKISNELALSQDDLENKKKLEEIKRINQKLQNQFLSLEKCYEMSDEYLNYWRMEFAVYANLVYRSWMNLTHEETKSLHEHLQKIEKQGVSPEEQHALAWSQLAEKLRLFPYKK